jgi:hypothetical protein
MARLLSRPGIEEMIDSPRSTANTEDDPYFDIWDAPEFKKFQLNGRPFREASEDEGRYIFSLAVDGFNPFYAKEAKATVSSTGIYMVMMNLPPSHRYRPENMYLVGIVPGPSKPSIEEMNHSLALLVDDLEIFWDPGVFLTRTAKYKTGRSVKAVLIPLVCDMLAARQVAGFGSATSEFFCTCCKLRIQDIENINKASWPKRDWEEHKVHAAAWKAATSPEERENLFKQHGIRWSELLRLPYWNAILFTVIDSMHVLYLGLFQTHCRQVWGIDVDLQGGDGTAIGKSKSHQRPPESEMAKCLALIKQGTEGLRERLSGNTFEKAVLWHICAANNLRRPGSKWQLAGAITEWVSWVHFFCWWHFLTPSREGR